MKLSKHRRLHRIRRMTGRPQARPDARLGDDTPSIPRLVAGIFARLRLAQRVRVLRRLLMPVGPMALAVLGGGAFAKFVGQARRPRMSVSLEDAARVTPNQVFELVRYVEQSDPQVLQRVMVVLARDAATMAAVGASVAAAVMRQLSPREPPRTQFA